MAEGDFLDDVMNEASVEAPVATPEPAAEATVRDDKGRFAPKGETESASPAPVDEPVFEHAAVVGERKRRQEAEERARNLEMQLQSLQQAEPEPIPSIWDDDQAALTHWQKQTLVQAGNQNHLITSELLSSQAHDDFDDMQAKFREMIQVNPALADQAMQSRHPWEAAYKIAKNAASAAELGATNVDELRAKIREELMAEIQAQPAAVQASLPTSLADAQSASVSNAQPASMTLKDILGR